MGNFCQSIFTLISLLTFLTHPTQMATAQSPTTSVDVGTVLDMSTFVGKMGLSCISMALSDFYASHDSYKTRIALNNRDSGGDVVAAAASALDLIKNVEVQALLGPITSMEAEFVIQLGEKSNVPIVSFTATSSSLSSIRSPYFVRSTLNDSSQVKAISSIIKAFGWRQVVPIYTDNEFGEGILPFLIDALEAINTRVPYRSVIPELATDDQIVLELYKLMTMQTRVFVVHMVPSLGSRFFTRANELGLMSNGYVWIITDAMANGLNSLDRNVIESMQGVIGVKPYVPQTKEVVNFTNRWIVKFLQDNPGVVNPQLNVFGLWAYDSATALAMAVEKSGTVNVNGFQKKNISSNSTDFATFGTSQNGPNLLQALLNTTFIGLSGEFLFVDGQLQSPPYQIVNVIGSGFKEIGFWTAKNGILRQLNLTNSPGNSELGTIIWPGDTTSLPKGWQIPTNGKKLRVGVPVKYGFSELVRVAIDPSTNTTTVTGYCIDVFDAVVASLPYALSYEYIPFMNSSGHPAGTYNDLIYQVYLGNFDAVVGDLIIIANRSKYVDFTLPYIKTEISMVVPIERKPNNKAWLFVKPLTWDLWLASLVSFVAIGMLIWFLEHRINEEFKGPISHQVGMVFWFSFCTMVFAHKEKITSNLARFVLIVWFLVVLILTQAYTASLTSMLTVQQLKPKVTDVNQLIKNKDYVGYQQGSYVLTMLRRMGFDESRLLVYNSAYELDQLFSKGSGNGGIAAAFDGNLYIELFLAKYCNKYTTVQPTYRNDGYGFVFPIGSPLVPDISRAILNVTEGGKMVQIENAWSLGNSQCPDSITTSITSVSLDTGSFWGLFLIVGVAMFFAFVIYLGRFLHEHWHIVTNPRYPLTKKIKILARHFDNKDGTSITFRNLGLRDSANVIVCDSEQRVVELEEIRVDAEGAPQVVVTLSPQPDLQNNTGPPSPSFSIHTEHDISFSGEQVCTSLEMMPVIQHE